MREIKFRGKTKVLNKWVVGSLIIDKERTWISVQQEHWNVGTFDNFEVVPESVGQYTGLKDKNGREIYEGDIVKGYIGANNQEYTGVCEYSLKIAGFKFGNKKTNSYSKSTVTTARLNNKEVIGNIYENKELLEVKGNE